MYPPGQIIRIQSSHTEDLWYYQQEEFQILFLPAISSQQHNFLPYPQLDLVLLIPRWVSIFTLKKNKNERNKSSHILFFCFSKHRWLLEVSNIGSLEVQAAWIRTATSQHYGSNPWGCEIAALFSQIIRGKKKKKKQIHSWTFTISLTPYENIWNCP